jgi:hypothetical protein
MEWWQAGSNTVLLNWQVSDELDVWSFVCQATVKSAHG